MIRLDETEKPQVGKHYTGFLRRFPGQTVSGCFTAIQMTTGNRIPAPGDIADKYFALMKAETMGTCQW